MMKSPTFQEYLRELSRYNMHSKYESQLYSKFPSSLKDMNSLILYGKEGIGKYSQMLNIVKRWSPTELKYEKKINFIFQKKHEYNFKISDIHYEVDMSLLGCNSRTIWNEYFHQLLDIIATHPHKQGIIVCTNFQSIHPELLDVFFDYIFNQHYQRKKIVVKYILLTTELSFIEEEYLKSFTVIPYGQPANTHYEKVIQRTLTSEEKKKGFLGQLSTIQQLKQNVAIVPQQHEKLSQRLVDYILTIHSRERMIYELRELLYDVLTYQLSIENVLWYILNHLPLNTTQYSQVNLEMYNFFKYYNNNYRPIFHLEKIILYLCTLVHEL